MKTQKISALASFLLALAPAAFAADVTVKLDDVHMCCNSCVKDADEAVAAVPGASAVADSFHKVVVITAPDQATAQKAVDALVSAGYYGSSASAGIKVTGQSGLTDAKVQSLTVGGVHLCCDKCATAAKKALAAVPGVTGSNPSKDTTSFVVTGDFSPKEAIAALQKAGLTGQVEKMP